MQRNNLRGRLQLTKYQLLRKLQSVLADAGLSNVDAAPMGLYITRGTQDISNFLRRGTAEQRAEKCRARAHWIAAATLLLIAPVSGGPLREPGRAIDSQRPLIESQNRIRDLDGKMQVKETQKADSDERVKEAGLSGSENAVLRSRLRRSSADLKGIEEQKTEAETKPPAETQAKEVVFERTVNTKERISEQETDLEETWQERDALEGQWDDRDRTTEEQSPLVQHLTLSIQPSCLHEHSAFFRASCRFHLSRSSHSGGPPFAPGAVDRR